MRLINVRTYEPEEFIGSQIADSAKLTEAINSMFAWYRDSQECFAHLEGVEIEGDSEPDEADTHASILGHEAQAHQNPLPFLKLSGAERSLRSPGSG
ncbi:hypothetical protein DL764_010539 [Monosporascus ibericus]|uniref:Uncharacterized protein n=1 Tax=Monosporascus ibericus TaxID=155417 RepID=A0A4Q4SSJ6_9PEZI|nr:hypothetical protein DL764_010539 [Monosporascus ibericus]